LTRFPGTFEEAAGELSAAIERSVAAAAAGERRVAVAFSGGLDSSVLVACAKRHSEVVACTAYAEGAFDAKKSKEGAGSLGVELVETQLTPELVEGVGSGMGRWPGRSLMDRSLWTLYSVVSRSAAEAGAGVILLGQLSDEMFGGYSKYQAALVREGEGVAESMMAKDMEEYAKVGRARDYDACSRWLPPRLPFEAAGVVEFAASIPISFKIRGGVRKAVLREAALRLGVPEELALTPKKAAQYSSGIQKLLA
jgi:asparagine synthase (glutamine-hydrolysing)